MPVADLKIPAVDCNISGAVEIDFACIPPIIGDDNGYAILNHDCGTDGKAVVEGSVPCEGYAVGSGQVCGSVGYKAPTHSQLAAVRLSGNSIGINLYGLANRPSGQRRVSIHSKAPSVYGSSGYF